MNIHGETAMGSRRALLLWLVAAVSGLAAYALWNNPVRHALVHLQPFGVAALLLAACTGFGWAARAPDLLTAAAVGIGICGALGFVAGLTHLLHTPVLILLMGAGIVLFAIAMLRLRPWRTWKLPQDGFWSVLGMAILIVILAAIIPYVVAPEVSTDALEYHLLVPRLYLEQNDISYLPLLVESNYPSLVEYVYLWILKTGDHVAAKCFHFLCTLLLLIAIARLVHRLAPISDGILGAALFLSMPVAALTSGWAWNDMIFTFFLVLSLTHLVDGRFWLAGVLFGLATWTKYTFVLVSIAFAIVLVRGLMQRWWRPHDVVRFALPVLAIASIWATKNAVYTGNPVYPFLNDIFQSPYWSEAADRYFRTTLTRFEVPHWNWTTYVLFPIHLVLKPRVVDVHPGPLMLLLLPFAFRRAGDRGTAALRTYAIALVAGWLLIRTETRSLMSLFAVLSVLYAASLESLRTLRSAVAAVIAVGVGMNLTILLIGTHVITDPARYFLGLESRHEYVERLDPKQKAYRWLDSQPQVGGTLLVGLHDPFYLRKPPLFSSCCDKPIAQQLVETHQTPAAMAQALKRTGITHVAVRTPEYRRENVEKLYSWSDQQREVFREFLAAECRPATRLGDVVIFALK